MAKKVNVILAVSILFFVVLGVYSNVAQQKSIDRSKIPEKVELDRGFQRWITNLKNKDIDINADEFRMLEENEIYNTKWVTVSSIEEKGKREEFEAFLNSHRDLKKVIFSPSDREFIDYRNIIRDGLEPNEVRFYGLKEDKIIDARILDCSVRANCYFDRAFFLDNDVFVITEISRNIHKHDKETPLCNAEETCTYTFKVHVIDLIQNSRLVYESEPFEAVLAELQPEL